MSVGNPPPTRAAGVKTASTSSAHGPPQSRRFPTFLLLFGTVVRVPNQLSCTENQPTCSSTRLRFRSCRALLDTLYSSLARSRDAIRAKWDSKSKTRVWAPYCQRYCYCVLYCYICGHVPICKRCDFLATPTVHSHISHFKFLSSACTYTVPGFESRFWGDWVDLPTMPRQTQRFDRTTDRARWLLV